VGRPELQSLIGWIKTGRLAPPGSEPASALLLEEAARQRVAPLLCAALAERADGWGATAIESLRARYHASFARGARQLDLAARLMRTFESAGLRVLPLKGVALAESAYDSVAERPMGDVDILALDDWKASVQVLEDAGLMAGERADHAWSFRNPEGQVVELHHSVTSCPGLFPLDREGLWRRRERTPAALVPWRPGAEDLLVQLALHAAFQHALRLNLVQYLDFRRLVERAALSGAGLREIVETSKAGPALAASLAVAAAVVGLPPGQDETWPRPVLPARLKRWLSRRLSEPADLLLQPPQLVRLRWELSRGRRWELLRGTLAPATPQRERNHWQHARRVLARTSDLLRRWL